MDPGSSEALKLALYLVLALGWGTVGTLIFVGSRRLRPGGRLRPMAWGAAAIALVLAVHGLQHAVVHAGLLGLLPGGWSEWASHEWRLDLPWLLLLAVLIGLGGRLSRFFQTLQETEERAARLAEEVESGQRLLSLSEDKFRTIFDEAEDAMVLMRPDLTVVEVNEASCRLLGRRRKELIGQPAWSFRRKDAQEAGRDLLGRAARAGFSHEADVPLLRPDGRLIYADVKAQRLTLGDRPYLMSVARETTESKRLRDALVEANQFLSTLVDNAEVAIVAADRQGELVLYNRRAAEISGYSRDEMGQQGAWTRLLRRETLKRLQGLGRPAPGRGEPLVRGEDWEITVRDGSRRTLLVSSAPFLDARGEIAGVVWFATDISERKRLEATLQEYAEGLEQKVLDRTRELTASEERYRDLYDAAPDLYLTLRPDGTIRDVNRAVLETLGRSRDEMVGRDAREFLPPSHHGFVSTARTILEEDGLLENVECPILRADGSEALTIVKARVRRDDEGGLAEVRVVLRDITRRKNLQRRLVQTERLATTGRLAASVAHEINNPLQALLTHLSLIGETLPEEFEARESWQRVEECVTRIRGVVNDLLDLHRADRASDESVDLNEVIREAVGLTESQLRASGIEARLELDEELPRVSGVPQRLYQVILNLLLNGAEAMAQGGTLRVGTRGSAGLVIAEVEDNGPGIPLNELPNIFDPFLSNRKAQGTGLGLFVSYSLVKDHQGEIEVESTPGEGTLFRVVLPAESAAAAGPPTQVESALPPD
jgi:PAS domain S-box-containing protein